MDYFKEIFKAKVFDKYYISVEKCRKGPQYKGEVTDRDYETFILAAF